MRQLRAQLSKDKISDTTIMAATFLWSAISLLGEATAMKRHAECIYTLVARRGGLKNLGLAGAVSRLIVSVDVYNSIVHAREPHYKTRNESWSNFRQPATSKIYGEAFNRASAVIDQDLDAQIVSMCLDSCRIVEVLEVTLCEHADMASYFHCLSELSSIGTQTAILCARFAATSTMNERVCITSQLVILLTFYSPPHQQLVATTQAERAISALQTLFVLTVWEDNVKIFIWILSVLVMRPYEYEGKKLALELLRQALASQLGEEKWAAGWEDCSLAILTQFVWSKIRFADYFNSLCEAVNNRVGNP